MTEGGNLNNSSFVSGFNNANDEDGMEIVPQFQLFGNSTPTTSRQNGSNNAASSTSFLNDDDDEIHSFEETKLALNAFPHFENIRRLGKLCDVTLISDEKHRFSAHKVVLAATIPYFRAMFTNDMIEAQQDEISMLGLEADTLEQLINYSYTGKVRISVENVQSLLVGASFLQLENVVDACCLFLKSRWQGSNVLAIKDFASTLNCISLVNAADKFIQKHFISICRTGDFLLLSLKDIVEILSRDELYVNSEEQVFEAAMCWIRHDILPRTKFVADLLACIRLPLLKPQYITDKVASNELIRGCLRCRDLVDEAKDYHLMPERRPLLQTFRSKPRCCNDIPGIIYAVGGLTNTGDSLSSVEMFDPMIGRSRVGVTVMNGLLYAIGGFNGHERLRTVEMFNAETRHWKEVASLNNKRSALGASIVGDKLYVCGGYDGITSLATVECYDAHQDCWSLMNGMNRQRSAAGIAVLDGKIYVMGGHDGMSIFNSVERFDPETGRWEIMKPMQNRRCRLGATALNDKLYACGGYNGSQFLRSVECYDPKYDEWKHVSEMNIKRSRVSLVANCGKLYAIGGYDGIANLCSMEIYSVESDTWQFGSSMMAHEGGVGIGVVPIVPHTNV